jgi:hypothetical protein
MGRGNPHIFTAIVNGPVNDNDVIDLNPQSLASKRKLQSTPIYLPQTHPVPDKRGVLNGSMQHLLTVFINAVYEADFVRGRQLKQSKALVRF